jgi:HAD superfamily hydrolase (TIGR01662 family)
MAEILREHGIRLTCIYYCRHHPDEGCQCRKPETLMARRAMTDFGIRAESSWVVGDAVKDVLMGTRAGLRSLLVRTGIPLQGEVPPGVTVMRDMEEAVGHIIREGTV